MAYSLKSSNSDRIRLFVIYCSSKNNENFVVRALSEVGKGEPALDRNFFHPLKFGILKTSIVHCANTIKCGEDRKYRPTG